MAVHANMFCDVYQSLPEHIAIVDDRGVICSVNTAWTRYAAANGYRAGNDWAGQNYREICEINAQSGDPDARSVLEGLISVVERKFDLFQHTYPCHSANEEAWYKVKIFPLHSERRRLFVVAHHDTTDEILYAKSLENAANTDSLTGLANRRCYQYFLDAEWRRGLRAGTPISMLVLDIDHFKMFNDTYGHVAGDSCLQSVAAVLKAVARRPSDLAARYGGEEFVVVLGGMFADYASGLAESIRCDIEALSIPASGARVAEVLTASVGVATLVPTRTTSPELLFELADRALYAAKYNGRNRVEIGY